VVNLPLIARRWAQIRHQLQARLAHWFTDREFFMRSNGQVRFIRVSAGAQRRAAGGVALLLLGWIGSLVVVATLRTITPYDRDEMLRRQARVEKAENRVAAYRKGLSDVAADIKRRQDFIEKVTQAHLGELPKQPRAGETVSNSQDEAQKTVRKISAALPEAAGLAQVEAQQLAFVEQLTRYADRRAADRTAALRKLGINPDVMLAGARHSQNEGLGGPFIPMSTNADGSLDPRFQRLGASLARMSALDESMTRLPQVLPASFDYISSGFGYRADPFTHGGAFHPGLDFRGPMGAPIYAAAKGFVSFAGPRAGYGKCIEVTHGNGLVTRYAHMSGFRARLGQPVAAGQLIGAIGSTGRSTGPHLHFEVRINDRPVNPRPFLEARTHVSEKANTAPAADD
jgi:murein DD-endopeptidase MepM/ murein hydrolase activator NlpD